MAFTCEISDPQGRRTGLGGCGWTSPWDCIADAGVAVAKAVATAGSYVGNVTGAFDAAAAVGQGVNWVCNNLPVQQASAVAQKAGAGAPYTQGAGVAVSVMCAGRTSAPAPVKVLQVASFAPPVPKYPPGTIQWQETKTGTWKLAIPATPTAGLGDVPRYWHVKTSDYPYLTAASGGMLGASTAYQIQPEAGPVPGVTIVSQADGERITGTQPFYKKTSFWLIAGGVVAAGVVGTVVIRRRHKHA